MEIRTKPCTNAVVFHRQERAQQLLEIEVGQCDGDALVGNHGGLVGNNRGEATWLMAQ